VPLNLIARLNGIAAGMVSGTEPNGETLVELISMWVAPFARGRAVGDALVDAVVAWARAQNARGVTLDVMEKNTQAIELYGRHRFVDVGSAPPPFEGDAPRRRMTYVFH
jgi:ribosomal protein S18 acetylase RimI-like enzyme